MNIVTRKEVAEYLNETVWDNNDPTGRLIPRVSDRLAAFTGRHDWGPSQSRTEYHDGGSSFVKVHYWPISSVTNIWEDADHVFDSDSVWTSSDYHISQNEESNGIIQFEGGYPQAGFENVKVTYTGGYASESAIPQRIKTACLLQIAFDALKRGAGMGASRNSEESALLPEVKDLLRPYTRAERFA